MNKTFYFFKKVLQIVTIIVFFCTGFKVFGQTTPVKMTITYDTPNAPNPPYTLPIPSLATNVEGKIWGGGGGGGGVRAFNSSGNGHAGSASSGGGGGGYSTVSGLSGTLTIVVGAGGTAGYIGASNLIVNGGNGGTSSINATTATGGGGGNSMFSNSGAPTFPSGAVPAGGIGNTQSGTPGTHGIGSGQNGNLSITAGSGGGAGNGGGNAIPNPDGTGVTTPSFSQGTPGTAPGGGSSGCWARNNSTTLTQETPGLPGSNGRVQISFTFDLEDIDPILDINKKVICENTSFTLSLRNPMAYIATYKLYRKVEGSIVPIRGVPFIVLNNANNFSYTVGVADGYYDDGTYFVVAEYNLHDLPPGATNVAFTFPGGTGPQDNMLESNPQVVNVVSSTSSMLSIYWSYNGVCTIDEEGDKICVYVNANHPYNTHNICNSGPLPGGTTWVPDSLNHTDNYFANYIRWDSIVYYRGYDVDINDFVWWRNASCTVANTSPAIHADTINPNGCILKMNGVLTAAGRAMQAAGRFQDFWQNQPHDPDSAWVSIGIIDVCGNPSPRLKVRVSISVDETFTPVPVCQTFYLNSVLGTTIPWLDIANAFDANIDPGYQGLLWFETQEDALNYFNYHYGEDIPDPGENYKTLTHFNLDVVGFEEYWAIRVDDKDDPTSCMSHPFKVTAKVVEPVQFWIEDRETGERVNIICEGRDYDFVIKFTGDPSFTIFSASENLVGMLAAAGINIGSPYAGTEPIFGPDATLRIEVPTPAEYSALPYSYQIGVRDGNFGTHCYSTNSAYTPQTQYLVNANLTVHAKPVISPISDIRECGTWALPATPTYDLRGGTLVNEGWMLETGVGTDLYVSPTGVNTPAFDFTDDGKRLYYFVENSCGTSYTDTVTVTVTPKPFTKPYRNCNK